MRMELTSKQGRYLAFIHLYKKLHGQSPAEVDMQAYFKTSPAAVHGMVVTLENRGFITRTPGQARSIRLLIAPEEVPDLETGEASLTSRRSLADAYPNVADWVAGDGWIEVGYDDNTSTFARAFDEGGMIWSGERRHATLEEALQALDSGIEEAISS